MNTAKHTPGPWAVRDDSIYGADGYFVSLAEHKKNEHIDDSRRTIDRGVEQRDANARLIAAAPDLLEALKLCESNVSSLLASSHPKVYGYWLDAIRAAIAKATDGEAMSTDIKADLLTELQAAHQIIKNALNLMTPEQKYAWAAKNESDGVTGEGDTRANERLDVIDRAKGT